MTEEIRQQLNTYIAEVACGDPESLDGIYRIAARRMYIAAFALLGDRSAAEDAVSESFIKIARFAKKYRYDEPMAWILKIVRNTALDALRKNKRRAEISTGEFFAIPDDGYSPEKRDTAVTVEAAMNKLEENERRIIYMRYFLDMTVRETASALKISRSAAQRLTEKAEENLKKLLKSDTND